MNERIRELALQAMTATTNKFSADREWSADEWRDFYDKKFAELIVQECADLFEVEWGEGKLTGNDVGYVVKKHFGVGQ